jgi:hypothetical protein
VVIVAAPSFDDDDGEIDWLRCNGDHRRTREILRTMGVGDVELTVAFLESRGGCCDCAVLFGSLEAHRNHLS